LLRLPRAHAHQPLLITLPTVALVERRRGAQVWQSSRPTYHSKILGPHFEETAREWARSFALDETGLSLGAVGTAEIADPAARTKHEVDLLALAPGERPQSPRASIILIGEAKATVQPRGLKDLERLEHNRALLADQGHRPEDAILALFSCTASIPMSSTPPSAAVMSSWSTSGRCTATAPFAA
jgi:hypothetical protein